jgi:hypothetical protein
METSSFDTSEILRGEWVWVVIFTMKSNNYFICQSGTEGAEPLQNKENHKPNQLNKPNKPKQPNELNKPNKPKQLKKPTCPINAPW